MQKTQLIHASFDVERKENESRYPYLSSVHMVDAIEKKIDENLTIIKSEPVDELAIKKH